MIEVSRESLKDLMYFGKTYCNPKELLERVLDYRKLEIPHEVLLEEGAIMYSLNWVFQEGTIEYFNGFPETNICDRSGRKTVYKIGFQTDSAYINGPSGFEVTIRVNSDGMISLTSYYYETIIEILKNLFDYDVH